MNESVTIPRHVAETARDLFNRVIDNAEKKAEGLEKNLEFELAELVRKDAENLKTARSFLFAVCAVDRVRYEPGHMRDFKP